MSIPPIVPTADQIVGPAIEALVARRPAALQHIQTGNVWSHPIVGLKAQAALNIRRLVALVASKRLPFATGAELLDLCASEFDTVIDPSPTTALGEVTLFRTGAKPAGVIRKGTKFARKGDPVGNPLVTLAAQYETVDDVTVPKGASQITLKLSASRSGQFANQLYYSQPSGLSPANTLFDPLFTLDTSSSLFRMAGGADKVTDVDARRIAQAFSQGQYAPVDGALIAGAYLGGARHATVVDDPATGIANVIVADESWCTSQAWADTIYRFLQDNEFIGFGARVNVVPLAINKLIHVDASIVVRDSSFLIDTTDIVAAVQDALRNYFDNRDDWYTFTLSAIQAAISRAHPHILTCTAATVKTFDEVTTLSEPGRLTDPTQATHFLLADNSTSLSFLSPT